MSSLLLPAEINTNGLIGIWFSIHGPSRGDALLIFDYLKKSNMLRLNLAHITENQWCLKAIF